VANKVSRSISLFTNLGGCKLAAAAGVELSAEAFRLAAVDVDGDRRNDLVAVGGEDDVWVLRNDGQGAFQAAGAYKGGPYPNAILAADLDPGGAPDLVVVNAGVPGRQGSGTVSVFRNKGDGSLEAARKYAAGERPLSAAAADLDGDGALDLAVTNQRSDTLSLYLNDGQGAFREPVTLAALKAPSAVVIADLDGDGSPDLAVAHFGSRVVSVLFNDGSGFSGK
jgi:hypothetical protein